MAYNNYFPQYYPSAQPYMPQPATPPITPAPNVTAPASQSNGINWVRGGENGANAYPVMAGRSELLMDADNPVFYIKTVDQSGMPMPLRIFDYSERKSPSTDEKVANPIIETDKFVSRDEFEDFKNEIKSEIRKPIPNRKTNSKEE